MNPFTWLNNERIKFNTWVASKLPGWKTHITAAIGLVGNTAFLVQQYIQTIPNETLQKYITGDSLVIFNLVLLSLVFWFRSLGNSAQNNA